MISRAALLAVFVTASGFLIYGLATAPLATAKAMGLSAAAAGGFSAAENVVQQWRRVI